MYNLALFAFNSSFFCSISQNFFGDLFFVNSFLLLYPIKISFPSLSFFTPLKILSLPPKIFQLPRISYSLSNFRSLTDPKSGGVSPKMWGVLTPKIPPASAPLHTHIHIYRNKQTDIHDTCIQLYIVQCTDNYTQQCLTYNVQCIMYTVQCIMYILYCTMYNV